MPSRAERVALYSGSILRMLREALSMGRGRKHSRCSLRSSGAACAGNPENVRVPALSSSNGEMFRPTAWVRITTPAKIESGIAVRPSNSQRRLP